MGKWDEFYTEATDTTPTEPVAAIDEVAPLDTEGMWRFCQRLSGKQEGVETTKSIVTYQTYDAATRPEDLPDPACERIFSLENAIADLSYDPLNPGLALLTLTFPSYADSDLRLFWARFTRFRQKETGSEEVKEHYIPVFLIHLFERDASSSRESAPETYVEANLVNPILCYLTRQLPADASTEQLNDNGEVIGGNVVKCLFSMSLVQFEEKRDVGFEETDTDEVMLQAEQNDTE